MARTYRLWAALGTCFILFGCGGTVSIADSALSDTSTPDSSEVPQQNTPAPSIGSTPAAIAVTCPAKVPNVLAPTADQKAAFKYHAVGVQIYQCQATGTGGYAWTFTAPRADLYNASNAVVGKHFAGPGGAATPEWQHNDGSFAIGSKTQSSPGATPNDIPWLLLTMTSHGQVSGKFSSATFIQRLNTSGGVAPTTPCDASVEGTNSEQPYTADYYFYEQDTLNPTANLRCGGGTTPAPVICPDNTPSLLKPPEVQNAVFKYHAIGVQIYTCTASILGEPSWVFTAPRADLYSASNELVAKHFAGPGGAATPEWQHNDESFAIGSKTQSTPGTTPSDIPWLLLSVSAHGGAIGKFSDVTWIQRLNTLGGTAPIIPCTATNLGATAEQPYQADYFFYRRNDADTATNTQCGG